MQLTREILDGGNDSRRGPIYGVADDGKAAVAHGVETAPPGALGEYVEIILRAIGMRRGENEIVRLEADNFFETNVGPVLCRVDDGGGACQPHGIGDKSALAYRDQRIRPDDEENPARRQAIQTLPQIGEVAFEIGTESGSGFGHAEHLGKPMGRRNDFLYGVGIGAVGRDT